jgi:hypothetical protein
VRFSRDRRGYVSVYLVDVPARQKRDAPRLLYWFRTPPGVKVGRDAFDEATRAAIESVHPDLTFDWEQIVNTPLPPPEVTPWRERRQQERAQKKALAALESEEPLVNDSEAGEPLSDAPEITGAQAADSGADPPDAAVRRVRRRRGRRGRRRSDAQPAPLADPESVHGAESSGTVEPDDQLFESGGDD